MLTSVEDLPKGGFRRIASPEKTMMFVRRNDNFFDSLGTTLHHSIKAHAKQHRIKIISHVYDGGRLHITFSSRPEMARFRLSWTSDLWSCRPMTRRQ